MGAHQYQVLTEEELKYYAMILKTHLLHLKQGGSPSTGLLIL